jgi:hypothetical protein
MQAVFFLALLPALFILRGRALAAWAIVLASCFAGMIAHRITPDQHTLLLSYSLIDCAAGLLVQASRTWQAKAMGCVYGVMILSHFTLHAGAVTASQHDFIGGSAGVALVLLLWIWGLGNGGISHFVSAVRRGAGTGDAGEKR